MEEAFFNPEVVKPALEYGFGGMSIILIGIVLFMIRKQTKFFDKIVISLDKVATTLDKVSKNVGTTTIGGEQTIIFFRAIMSDHIRRKLRFIREVLSRNNLKKNEITIKKKIESEIKRITSEEVYSLGRVKSIAGDLSCFLKEIDIEVFLVKLNKIIFSDMEINEKISNCEYFMQSYVTKIIEKVEDEIRKNTL